MTGAEKVDVREVLAAVEHARWSGWQRWLHNSAIHNADGSLTIQRELVERWERQIATSYADLPEHEKDSDRVEADKNLAAIREHYRLIPKGALWIEHQGWYLNGERLDPQP